MIYKIYKNKNSSHNIDLFWKKEVNKNKNNFIMTYLKQLARASITFVHIIISTFIWWVSLT